MSLYHVQAVFDQFRWLHEDLANLKPNLRWARVSRADLKTLDLQAGSWGGEISPSVESKVFLFDQNGGFLTDRYGRLQITRHRSKGSKWYHRLRDFFTYTPLSRTVREALVKLGDKASLCAYIVEVENDASLTVFRAPKENTIAHLLEKEGATAREEVAESLSK